MTTDCAKASSGHPSAENDAAHKVAMAVRAAYLATAEIYQMHLNPETAELLRRDEGDLWSIRGRINDVLKGIDAHA